MLARWSIRQKLYVGVAVLFGIIAILSFCSFRGVYAYRYLVRNISHRRATELRLASELSWTVGELRAIVNRARHPEYCFPSSTSRPPLDTIGLREDFRKRFVLLRDTLQHYRAQLDESEQEQADQAEANELSPERQTLQQIELALEAVTKLNRDDDWALNEVKVDDLDGALAELHTMALKLPFHLQQRMQELAGGVRGQYRRWIILTWVGTILSVVMLTTLLHFSYRAVFQPLQTLIRGSRRVARDGDFAHRIELTTHDEVAELAHAMNAMTERFQRIREDLDRQIAERDQEVAQRTTQVVRSEQLASVGFLAAGVAHEINNPLASIAWCAESLESRLHDILQQDDAQPDGAHNAEIAVLRDYLRKIQDEAFRCKGITERLLDFSRMGDIERQDTDLRELVQGVIDMVRHLGSYRQKHLEFTCQRPVIASVCAQEMKQVVLNLITNGLDSLDPGGTIRIRLGAVHGQVELVVEDNGCGMSAEVLRHLFEPFFTRRRDGQGTGLGLSISYRIVQEHGGTIEPFSEGPGHGSRFRVTFPLVRKTTNAHEEKRQAA